MEENLLYFRETLELFYENRWLYEDPVTEILVKGHLDSSLPRDWLNILKGLDNEELNNLIVNKSWKNHWPTGLVNFIEKCAKLDKLSNKHFSEPPTTTSLPSHLTRGLSIKKQHEIFYLARLTHEKCLAAGLNTIVDLGAGLGYICQILNYMYGYRILGLESNERNTKTAKERQISLYPKSIEDVKYVCMTVTENSSVEIENLLDSFLNHKDQGICLIGLHSCADLSVNACKLFSKMSKAKLLIMVSCCYHKIEFSNNNDSKIFKNFPLSESLSCVIDEYKNDIKQVLTRPFLRLACQEPADRWKDMSENIHREHAFCVIARAVLELFAHQNNLNLKKQVRKATRKSQCLDFDTYLADSLQRYTFNDQDLSNDSNITNKIKEIWEENKQKLENAEIFTGLQLLLQAPAESLVLNDRRVWLMEQGYNSEIVPVLSSRISPRSQAIISRKQ